MRKMNIAISLNAIFDIIRTVADLIFYKTF